VRGKPMRKMHPVILLLLVVFASMLVPVKFSVSLSEISDKESNVYLCRWVDYTGAEWELVGNKYGMFDESEAQNVIIEGFDLYKEFSDVIINNLESENTYVIYGDIVGERPFDNYLDSETQKVIKCEGWDILYPIIRGDTIRPILPKKYLTIYDIEWGIK
jgi:hypothetical protein